MALTVTRVKGSEFEAGRLRGLLVDIQFDTSYLTAGELISPDDVGFVQILGASCVAVRTAAGAAATVFFLPVFNPVTGSIQAVEQSAAEGGLPEVDSTENPSANIYTMLFLGW
jgi:hypothetical protein